MKIETIKLDEEYLLVYDSDWIDVEKINCQKILMLIYSNGCTAHDMYLFDFSIKNKIGKKRYTEVINKYALLESYTRRPFVIIHKNFDHVIPDPDGPKEYLTFWDIGMITYIYNLQFTSIKIIHYNIMSIEPYKVTKEDAVALHGIFETCIPMGMNIKHLARYGNFGLIEPEHSNPHIDVIVISSNPSLYSKCLMCLSKCNYSNLTVHLALFKAWGSISSLSSLKTNHLRFDDGEFNFSSINNQIFLEHCKGDYVLLLNDDVFIQRPDALDHMVYLAKYEDAAIVGSALYYPPGYKEEYNKDRTINTCKYQHGGVYINKHRNVVDHTNRDKSVSKNFLPTREVGCVTFAMALIKSSIYKELMLDETLPGDFNDVDFCMRAKQAGYKIWYSAQAEAIHAESATRKDDPNYDRNKDKVIARNYINDNEKILREYIEE